MHTPPPRRTLIAGRLDALAMAVFRSLRFVSRMIGITDIRGWRRGELRQSRQVPVGIGPEILDACVAAERHCLAAECDGHLRVHFLLGHDRAHLVDFLGLGTERRKRHDRHRKRHPGHDAPAKFGNRLSGRICESHYFAPRLIRRRCRGTPPRQRRYLVKFTIPQPVGNRREADYPPWS